MTVVLDTTKKAVPKKAVCTHTHETPAPKPVKVNGVTIARDAIVREMQHHAAAKPIAAWQRAARALVIRELLLREARRLEIAAEPLSDEEGRRETDEEAMIRALIEREVAVPEPDEATCRRYYEQNLVKFRSADIYEATHILFPALSADEQGYAQARATAEAIAAALTERPEAFAAFAKSYSRCPSAAQGGNLGQITAGQVTPEFEQALNKLKPGEITAAPVATRYGFHVIKLDRKIEGQALPYELVASRIADYLRNSVRRRADAQYLARLVSSARIEGVDIAGADSHRVH
jgi:peptidyl-prolyl cis-trans isomerase C